MLYLYFYRFFSVSKRALYKYSFGAVLMTKAFGFRNTIWFISIFIGFHKCRRQESESFALIEALYITILIWRCFKGKALVFWNTIWFYLYFHRFSLVQRAGKEGFALNEALYNSNLALFLRQQPSFFGIYLYFYRFS